MAEGSPADPYLETAAGQVYLSWTEQAEDTDARNVLVAPLDSNGATVGDPRQMNDQPGEISSHGGENLAKFAVASDGGIVGIWMKPQPEYHTGDQRFAHADADGPFSPAETLNDDGLIINHAFSAITTSPDGKVYAAWIDGRDRTNMEDDRQHIYAAISEDGGRTFGKNYRIASAVCPCCRPDFVFLNDGSMVISYRNVTKPDNVRDHVVIRSEDDGKTFSPPVLISDDGWTSEGCPHVGISITADQDNRIHAVWWTGGRSEEEAGIYHAYSEDGGASFSPRQLLVEVGAKNVLHTQITTDANNNLYAVWENIEDGKSQVFFSFLSSDTGQWSKASRLSEGTQSAMFPVIAAGQETLVVAWTEREGETSQVKLRTAPLAG